MFTTVVASVSFVVTTETSKEAKPVKTALTGVVAVRCIVRYFASYNLLRGVGLRARMGVHCIFIMH